MKQPRAALYLRVSREEQSLENQRADLEQLARRRDLEVTATYEEKASAAKTRERFEAMLRDGKRGAFDVLVTWSLDRFGRSMVGNMQAVIELDRAGVRIVSAKEPWLDTSGPGGAPVRALLVAIFSWVAEQERVRIVERTHAGLARARRKGTRLGRPERVGPVLERQARALLEQGQSIRAVAKALGIPSSTLHRALRSPEEPT